MTFQQKIFYINSRNRLSGTDSDFTYSIDLKNFSPDSCLVLQCNLPKSFFIVQENENTITLTEEDVNTVEITIPAGNYNRINFKTVLQSLLNLNSPNGYTYTITTPNNASSGDDGKYSFTCAGYTLESKIIMASDNNMFELMGFDRGSTNTFSSGVLKSSNVIKMTKEDTVFIHSDIVGGLSNGILQEIYSVDSSDFSNIIFHQFAPDFYTKPMRTNNSNVFNFYLTNEDGEKLNLNGLNWSLTLVCFKKDNSLEAVKEYMKYNLMRS